MYVRSAKFQSSKLIKIINFFVLKACSCILLLKVSLQVHIKNPLEIAKQTTSTFKIRSFLVDLEFAPLRPVSNRKLIIGACLKSPCNEPEPLQQICLQTLQPSPPVEKNAQVNKHYLILASGRRGNCREIVSRGLSCTQHFNNIV